MCRKVRSPRGGVRSAKFAIAVTLTLVLRTSVALPSPSLETIKTVLNTVLSNFSGPSNEDKQNDA